MKLHAFFAFTLAWSSLVLAADPAGIAYVDMQRVLEESKLGKAANAELEDKFAERQGELAKEEREIRELQVELARDEALMSQEMLDRHSAEIDQRVQALQREVATAQRDLLGEQNRLGRAILSPAARAIDVVAKEKSLSAVFERRQSGLLFIDEGLDITDAVIKRLDAQGDTLQ